MRWLLGLALGLRAGAAPAQCAPLVVPDTGTARVLDSIVVVTAERGPSILGASVAAVTRLSAAQLARMPQASLADVLRLAPGFGLVQFDGLGFDPGVMVRGFYGGGEAEYVVVLVDGQPVSQLQSGVVAWDVLPPLAGIAAIEIVRGGASSLYGDAAIGGVINLITRARAESGADPRVRGSLGGGSHGTWRVAVDLEARAGAPRVGLGAGLDRTSGFRDHAERTAARGRASITLVDRADARAGLTLASHWREYDEPGPLLESLLAADRRGSDPLFRFDHTTDRDLGLGFEWSKRIGGAARLRGTASGELRRLDAIRTLALAPGFGDTKERLAETGRLAAGVQLDVGDSPLPGPDRFTVGLEASRGALDSRYYDYALGTRTQYATGQGQRGALDTSGESARTTGAAYALYSVQASPLVRLSLGARLDHLRDRFDQETPSGEPRRSTTHSAVSPKLGINLGFLRRSLSNGNLYLAVGRSFKAPTLDQLYDLRRIPVPFPPFAITTSNPDLVPQRGTSVELGVYQSTELAPTLRLDASVSAYHMDMRDELDFDVESFRYVNVGRSRHRGLETGATLEGSRAAAFAAWTVQAATARSGVNEGKRLKAIPRHTLSAGVSLQPLARRPLQLALSVAHTSGAFLDDANTRPLENTTRVDARGAFRVAGVELLLDLRNLLNSRYNSSGFLDPAGSGEAYFYPAAGRVIEAGLRYGW